MRRGSQSPKRFSIRRWLMSGRNVSGCRLAQHDMVSNDFVQHQLLTPQQSRKTITRTRSRSFGGEETVIELEPDVSKKLRHRGSEIINIASIVDTPSSSRKSTVTRRLEDLEIQRQKSKSVSSIPTVHHMKEDDEIASGHRRKSGAASVTSSPARRRRSSHAGVGVPVTLARKLGMSKPIYQRILLTSWHKICDVRHPRGALMLMERVFESLCSKEQLINNLFLHSAFIKGMAEGIGHDSGMKTINDHAKFLLWLIGDVMSNLDKNSDDTMAQLIGVGAKHSKLKILGFTNKYWDKFGQKWVDAMVLNDNVRRQQDAAKVWTIIIAGICDAMCTGFLKRKNTSTTT